MPLVSFELADPYYETLLQMASSRGVYLEEMMRSYLEDRLLELELTGRLSER